MKTRLFLLLTVDMILAVLSPYTPAGEPLSTAFTYQGHLKQGGVVVDEPADLEFSLWDASIDGAQIGSTVSMPGVDVVNGLFIVRLDFGEGVFVGEQRWLEISVSVPANSGLWETMSPRQEVTPAPYALYALNCPDSRWNSNGDDICFDEGRVGIGTCEPASQLEVLGDVRVNGTFLVDTSDAGNEVLDQSQTDANLQYHISDDWQSFTGGIDGYLVHLEVKSLSTWYWGEEVTLTVYEGEGAAGEVLYSETDIPIGYPPESGVVAFYLPITNAPWLTAGQLYTFQIGGTEPLIWLANGNPYADGTSSFGSPYDLWFQTYMNQYYNEGGILSVTRDGRVGIGTSSPNSEVQMHVYKRHEACTSLMVENTAAEDDSQANLTLFTNQHTGPGGDGKISFIKASAGIDWGLGIDASDSCKFKISGGTATGEADREYPLELDNKLTITSDGNVGVGTTSPSAKLDIAEGGIAISKSFPNLPAGEWSDIDVNVSALGALYLVTMVRAQDSSNVRQYLLLLAGTGYGCTANVIADATSGDLPIAYIYGVFRGEGPGSDYTCKLQIQPHERAHVYVSKIQTYP